jgi:hypothetical protein
MGMFDLGIGGLYKGFKSFMNPEKGYQKGQEQLDKYYQQGQQYLQPYTQHGEEAYGALNEAQNNLLNPSSLHDRWIQDYNQSEASKIAQARAMEQGNRAASTNGVLGSTPHLQAMQAGSAEIGAQDMEHYIDRMIQQYLQGAGIAQGIYGQGANAAGAMSNNANQMGQNSAEMAYGKQNAPGNMFNDLLKTGAYAFTGGAKNPWTTKGGK